jgi:hypothetical protein
LSSISALWEGANGPEHYVRLHQMWAINAFGITVIPKGFFSGAQQWKLST